MKKVLITAGICFFLYWFFVVQQYRLVTVDPHLPLVGGPATVTPTAAPIPTPTPSPLGEYRGTFSDLWWYLFWAAFLFLPVAGILGAFNRWLWVPSRLRWADRFTGLHPIEVKPGAGLVQRAAGALGLGPAVNEVINNYNHAPAATYSVKRHGSRLDVVSDGHGLTDADVLTHAQKHIPIRQTVARNAGGPARNPNRAMMLGEAGYFEQLTREKRAKADHAEHRLNEATRPPEEAPAPAPFELLSMKQAAEQSTPNAWILGQNEKTGALATFDPRTGVHIAILGATGSGKTESTGMLTVGLALKFGYQVIVLDGKGGADWGFIKPWATYYDVEPANYLAHLDPIYQEYVNRAQAIKRAGVTWYYELKPAPRPWFVLLEEYGDINDNLPQAERERVNGILKTLVRKARTAGIHLCFIDQYPEKWDQQLLQNTKTKIVYRLNDAAIVKEYKAYDLADAGEFYLRGVKYTAWHARPKMRAMLATVNAAPRPMLTVNLPAEEADPDAGSVRGIVRDDVRGNVRGDLPVVDPPTHEPTNGTNGAEPARPKWWDWVYNYMQDKPGLWEIPAQGVSQMAREMSKIETGGIEAASRYKGIASDLCRRIREEYGAQQTQQTIMQRVTDA